MPPRQPPGVCRRPRQGYVRRMLVLAAVASLPALVLVVALLGATEWFPEAHPSAQMAFGLVLLALLWWGATMLILRERMARPLQTLANLLSALREGDYSFRARGGAASDALGEVMVEVNTLVETMRQQRLGALEATALLRTVMGEINVAVFAFDAERRLRLVNRAGERLLAQPVERLLGRSAEEAGLAECVGGEVPRTVQMSFAGGAGRWRVSRQQFRQGGLPHQLLVLSDLSRELREEERQAWQRVVRVLGHELNNSLAPVKSIAGSLAALLQRDSLPPDWREDMRDGLTVIGSRAEALNRFVSAYAQLARLPKPRPQPVELGALVPRVANLETRCTVQVTPGPAVTVNADPDQLEQALINLIRNAVDAVLEAAQPLAAAVPGSPAVAAQAPDGAVRVGWACSGGRVELIIEDEGPGLPNTTNLFVPFFTTKQKGSGIGLVLCRQVAEGHGGELLIENRKNRPGAVARLRLPLDPRP